MAWIFDNIRFPYPNMQQLNLDWLMEKLGNLPSVEYPISVDDGGTGERTKLAALDSFGVSQFIDRDEIRAAYKKDIADTLASYFSEFRNNACLVGTPKGTNGTNPVPVYNNEHGWTQLLTIIPTRFDWDDTASLYGVTCNKFYSDCTTWVSLVTRCKKYQESPYCIAFADPQNVDINDLIEAALDNDMQKPWTIDFLNKWVGLGGELYSSGGKGKRIFRKTLTEEEIDNDAIDHLETGDIIFFGANDPQFVDQTFYIHHCGIFIKDLDELNSSSYVAAGQRIRAIDLNGSEAKSSRGYVAHCAGGILSTTYNSVIRIQTIEEMLLYDEHRLTLGSDPTTEIGVYACRPMQNIMNSSKRFYRATGLYPMWGMLIGEATQANNTDKIVLDFYRGRISPQKLADVTGKGLTATIYNSGGVIDITVSGTLNANVAAAETVITGLPVPINAPIQTAGTSTYLWNIDSSGNLSPVSSKSSGDTVLVHFSYIKAL